MPVDILELCMGNEAVPHGARSPEYIRYKFAVDHHIPKREQAGLGRDARAVSVSGLMLRLRVLVTCSLGGLHSLLRSLVMYISPMTVNCTITTDTQPRETVVRRIQHQGWGLETIAVGQ